MKPTILIIDDDTSLRRVLEYNLQEAGYSVAAAAGGEEGLRLFAEVQPFLVISDMKMPGMDGMQVLQSVKQRSPETPVIMITAFGSVDMAVEAMKAGAYDYITKPFNNAEVIARVNAVLRRTAPSVERNVLSFPKVDLEVNLSTYEVIYKNRHMDFTGKMFEVFSLLARSAPKVVTYQEISETVWGENSLAVRNRLKYLVYLLRQEFQKVDPSTNIIENIDRLGYKLVTEPYQL